MESNYVDWEGRRFAVTNQQITMLNIMNPENRMRWIQAHAEAVIESEKSVLIKPLRTFEPEVSTSVEATLAQRALDVQEGGNHYKDMAIQPVEYITANEIPFMEGSVIKYVSRHKAKNGAQDIKKAIHFLNLILELHYPESK